MNKLIRIIITLFILWAISVSILILNTKIAFGHGLGDIYYLLFLFFIVVLSSIIFIKNERHLDKPTTAILFLFFIIAVIIAFTFKLSIGRGPEYPWNGKIFLS